MKDAPYRFCTSEPGIFVEIYLPKKSYFQGILYDTLIKGFNVENVKDHFRDPKKEQNIKRLLEDYPGAHSQYLEYNSETIDRFPSLFFGYSMYEVDGVFAKRKRSCPSALN